MSVALVLLGCGTETVTVDLSFPSAETFVRSESARILVVPIDAGEEGVCPDLLAQARIGVLDAVAVEDTGMRNVCDFRAEQVELEALPEGLHAYVAVAQGPAGEVWLTGCTIADVYVDAPPLRIVLDSTDEYRRAFPAGHPRAICTPDAKCELGCTE